MEEVVSPTGKEVAGTRGRRTRTQSGHTRSRERQSICKSTVTSPCQELPCVSETPAQRPEPAAGQTPRCATDHTTGYRTESGTDQSGLQAFLEGTSLDTGPDATDRTTEYRGTDRATEREPDTARYTRCDIFPFETEHTHAISPIRRAVSFPSSPAGDCRRR